VLVVLAASEEEKRVKRGTLPFLAAFNLVI
jgi:hypothetical protein